MERTGRRVRLRLTLSRRARYMRVAPPGRASSQTGALLGLQQALTFDLLDAPSVSL